jgi:hypothetical protein
MTAWTDVPYAISKVAWMRAQGIWPTGRRYLWTDAFGLVFSCRSTLNRAQVPCRGAKLSDRTVTPADDPVRVASQRLQTRFHDDGRPTWFATIRPI